MLVEQEALRQQANLPPGPLVTNALPNLFRNFAEELADSYGVQTNVFVPDANPKINTLNRFVAIQTLHDVFDFLANAAIFFSASATAVRSDSSALSEAAMRSADVTAS